MARPWRCGPVGDPMRLEAVHLPRLEKNSRSACAEVDEVGDVVLVPSFWRPPPRPPRAWVRKTSAATVLM